ncbi:MAG: hypothetical protein JXB04_01450, partial [Kiritimatiellae bacterium]|nr:hypothetical protein [Kiritimatiellia bacterium]
NQESPDLLTEVEKMNLRAKVNELTMDVRESTKTAVKSRIAEAYNAEHKLSPKDPGYARAEDVTFFEATNPPKPGQVEKVKMDWDMTPRVRGKDVAGGKYETMVQEEFYRAAGGRSTFGAESSASSVAHQQRVEVVTEHGTEAYGTSAKEGQRFIEEPSTAPVDVDKTVAYKSEDLLAEAAKLEAEGRIAEAEALKFRAYRESAKQFDKLTTRGVEELGGTIDPHVREGVSILKEVGPGGISPEKAAQRLAEIGETPESIISKASSQLDAAGKMSRAAEVAAGAPAAQPSPVLEMTQKGTRGAFMGLMVYGGYSSIADTMAAPEGAERAERATRHAGAWIGGTGGALGAGYLTTCLLTGPAGWTTFLVTTGVGLAGAYAGGCVGDQAADAAFDTVNPDAVTVSESDRAAQEQYSGRDVGGELTRLGVPAELATAADYAFKSGDHEKFSALMTVIKEHYSTDAIEERVERERQLREAHNVMALYGEDAWDGPLPEIPELSPLDAYLDEIDREAVARAESEAAAMEASYDEYKLATEAEEMELEAELAEQEQSLESGLAREKAVGESVLAEQEAAREDSVTARSQDLMLKVGEAVGSGFGGGAGSRVGSAIMAEKVDDLEEDQSRDEGAAGAPSGSQLTTGTGSKSGSSSHASSKKKSSSKKKKKSASAKKAGVLMKSGQTQPAVDSVSTPGSTATASTPTLPASGPEPVDKVLMTGNQTRDPYPGEVTHRDKDTGYLLPGP